MDHPGIPYTADPRVQRLETAAAASDPGTWEWGSWRSNITNITGQKPSGNDMGTMENGGLMAFYGV